MALHNSVHPGKNLVGHELAVLLVELAVLREALLSVSLRPVNEQRGEEGWSEART